MDIFFIVDFSKLNIFLFLFVIKEKFYQFQMKMCMFNIKLIVFEFFLRKSRVNEDNLEV